ncbi:hypothetical protein PR048_007188 [Dryococelus australis]|uniref:Uncharacterized protein n=1 Tax=Dryococelus australis TaxID=614101 RepID=A0ABQ9IDX7_9NEOP|nr:hypothetical protein PR048_007188 [Dryococelus australis]
MTRKGIPKNLVIATLELAKEVTVEGRSLVGGRLLKALEESRAGSPAVMTQGAIKRAEAKPAANSGRYVSTMYNIACREGRKTQPARLGSARLGSAQPRVADVTRKCRKDYAPKTVSLLACHQSDPGSIPGRVTRDSRVWESCRTMQLVRWVFSGSLVSPAISFRRCSILTPITLIGSQDVAVKNRLNLFTHSLTHSYLAVQFCEVHFCMYTKKLLVKLPYQCIRIMLNPVGRAGAYGVSGRTPYAYKGRKSCKERSASRQRGIGQSWPAIGAMTTSLSVLMAKTMTRRDWGKPP